MQNKKLESIENNKTWATSSTYHSTQAHRFEVGIYAKEQWKERY